MHERTGSRRTIRGGTLHAPAVLIELVLQGEVPRLQRLLPDGDLARAFARLAQLSLKLANAATQPIHLALVDGRRSRRPNLRRPRNTGAPISIRPRNIGATHNAPMLRPLSPHRVNLRAQLINARPLSGQLSLGPIGTVLHLAAVLSPRTSRRRTPTLNDLAAPTPEGVEELAAERRVLRVARQPLERLLEPGVPGEQVAQGKTRTQEVGEWHHDALGPFST